MKIGIVGLDSSHAVMFARFFNEREAGRLGRVTAAWPGGSQDVALSAGRVAEFTRQVREQHGVRIVSTAHDVAAATDAVLLLSMDGRVHAAQFAEIAEAATSRKTPLNVYINKPLAASSDDARAIAAIAEKSGVRWFSASMLRFVEGFAANARDARITCPLWWDDGANPGWLWYGMHGIELAYAAMGAGVVSVSTHSEAACETATLRWRDGRGATVRGALDKEAPYALALNGGASREIPLPAQAFEHATAAFLANGSPPVSNTETLEIMRCVEALNESRARGGREIML